MSPSYGGELNVVIGNDYNVNLNEDSNNVITDVETFQEAFSNFPGIVEHAQDFLDVQEEYGVNAVFAGAVAANESGGGTSAIAQNANNWFGVKGDYNGMSHNGWSKYPTVKDSIKDFADIISREYFAYGSNTIFEIGEGGYCDPPDKWIRDVSSLMTSALQKVM